MSMVEIIFTENEHETEDVKEECVEEEDPLRITNNSELGKGSHSKRKRNNFCIQIVV